MISANVAFISILESFKTDAAFGRAMAGTLSVFAQLERENIFERTPGRHAEAGGKGRRQSCATCTGCAATAETHTCWIPSGRPEPRSNA